MKPFMSFPVSDNHGKLLPLEAQGNCATERQRENKGGGNKRREGERQKKGIKRKKIPREGHGKGDPISWFSQDSPTL